MRCIPQNGGEATFVGLVAHDLVEPSVLARVHLEQGLVGKRGPAGVRPVELAAAWIQVDLGNPHTDTDGSMPGIPVKAATLKVVGNVSLVPLRPQ